MIQFERLRLSGFKSFVDPVEVPISPGMTGIVGPNGCGKSNLVEALTWVMGETSARQMRGAEMDDVIFGGSATRPSRNLAEAVLVLDNKDRNAPAQFNDTDTIEVLRRIDRGRGSTYRVNGKEVRAKDVHILFADASAGPRSPAIINQGRVGALISSKATDRRSLLEEAAGIGGLHARRHEAELRLRAAEANLTRLEDVVGALANELTALKRQARQASRYRNLTEHIRDAEIRLLAARWTAAAAAVQRAASRRCSFFFFARSPAVARGLPRLALREKAVSSLASAPTHLPGGSGFWTAPRRSSASWRLARAAARRCRRASSTRLRRSVAFDEIRAPTRPWLMMAGEGQRGPAEASANRIWTSLARTSLPIDAIGQKGPWRRWRSTSIVAYR